MSVSRTHRHTKNLCLFFKNFQYRNYFSVGLQRWWEKLRWHRNIKKLSYHIYLFIFGLFIYMAIVHHWWNYLSLHLKYPRVIELLWSCTVRNDTLPKIKATYFLSSPGISEENQKKFSQDSGSSFWDFNPVPSIWEAFVLPLCDSRQDGLHRTYSLTVVAV
jgi:hypothetical protein